MRPEIFQLAILDRSELAYFPGEILQGVLYVLVGPTQQCMSKGITVSCKGKATVTWTEANGAVRSVQSRTEIYFDHKVCLLGTGETQYAQLPPGSYKYPFQFTLPEGLPSSFVGSHGKVHYRIQADMVAGQSLKINHKAKLPFTINHIIDLNIDPKAAKPVERKKYKNLCCFVCKSGPVGFTLKIPKTGFASGEFLKFIADFNNQSGRRVKTVTFYLVQKVTYQTKIKSKSTYKNICKINGPLVEPGESERWEETTMRIPPLPPTSVDDHMIQIQYFLKIEMHLSGSSINLRHMIPIKMGSIPLRNYFKEIKRLEYNVGEHVTLLCGHTLAVAPMNSRQLPYFEIFYPDIPTPSYAEAMNGLDSDLDQSNGLSGGRFNTSFEAEDLRSSSSNPRSSSNSVPLMHLGKQNKFAPKYITYGWRVEK